MKEYSYRLYAEEIEFLADLLEEYGNKTALEGINNGKGDIGAWQLAAMFRGDLES